jgi:hypothetical protein
MPVDPKMPSMAVLIKVLAKAGMEFKKETEWGQSHCQCCPIMWS